MKCLEPRYSSSRHAYVPCGQCYYCRTRKKFEWVVRCLLERMSYKYGYFLTLTYDNDHLPKDKGVSYYDADSFLDSLRRYYKKKGYQFSYYLMSEYGGRTNRPHYHMHLFTDAPLLFVKNSLDRYWKHGFHRIGRTTIKSVIYTSSFHLLPKEYFSKYPQPNFHIFTRGLGYRFFDNPTLKSYYLDNNRTVFEFGGQSYHLPPYIIKKIGIDTNSDLRSLNLFQVKNNFYLHAIEQGQHSNIWKSWDSFCNILNSKLIKQGLKYKI